MDKKHIHRILTLLEDEKSFLSTSHLVTRQANSISPPNPLWENQIQWKWFFRDIGKHSCVLGLLPFVEIATNTRQSVSVECHSLFMDKRETLELFYKKSDLVTEWASAPSKITRRKIIELLPPAEHHLKYDLHICGGASDITAVAFVNWLILIIVGERHFQNNVLGAFNCVRYMGYEAESISDIFKENIRRHYKSKL